MVQQQPTVADIFRRAQSLRQEHTDWSLKQLREQLVKDFSGGPFPPLYNLTIPEQDDRAPEEDWTAGLPIVLRGIQNNDWNDVVHGIIISLEQVENYPKQSGREDDPAKEWRNRGKSIAEAEDKVIEKWMPEELMAMAKRKVGS